MFWDAFRTKTGFFVMMEWKNCRTIMRRCKWEEQSCKWGRLQIPPQVDLCPARNLYLGWPAALLCCFEETTFAALSQAAASLKKPLHRLAKLLCKGSGNFSTAFVCICPNCIMYLSRLWNVFVQIVKCTNAGVLIDRCRRDRYHSHFQHGF